MAEPPPVERNARVLAKVVIALGFSLGPLLMVLGFILAIGRDDSVVADRCFYGGATGGGLALVVGFAALVILPRPPPSRAPPVARVLRSRWPRKPPT
jgi:hypothetical protein